MINQSKGKLSNPSQLGGIETSVLDNGPGRGVRIAWFNTGSPLRYKVILDRGMDIRDAFFGASSLAWLSHGGVTTPHTMPLYGIDWLHGFAGGLVTTCGLGHVGAPESDDHGERGLHGMVSHQVADIISIQQPDPEQGQLTMSMTGLIRESRVFGPYLELRRTISSELGRAGIRIQDQVTNRGNQSVPHMLLYHCNLGYPLLDEGASILWQGKALSRGGALDDAIFASQHDCHVCPAPLPNHDGMGEACGFIRPEGDDNGITATGVKNEALDLALKIEFDVNKLPCLCNWQHWGRGEYVTGLEPATHFPLGQSHARNTDEKLMLEPGETRDYFLELTAGPAALWTIDG